MKLENKSAGNYILLGVIAILLLVSLPIINFNCFESDAPPESDIIVQLWETEAEFKIPESCYFDAERNIVYVSNVDGSPLEKDSAGFISKLSPEGKIVNLNWIDGLHAPKGMGVYENKLYVTNIDEIVEIDIEQNTILKKYPVEGAVFLNDIDVDAAGNVYASDMSAKRIYRLQDGVAELWSDDELLVQPNGLFVDGNHLLIGIKNSVLAIRITDKKIRTLIENTGSIDGLKALGNGSYIISDWSGAVHIIHPEREKRKILDTRQQNINVADIDFCPKTQILYVPTFVDNRVMAYKINLK